MFAGAPQVVPCDQHLDSALEEVHPGSAVFVLRLRDGEPYLGRTGVLRRRLKRLLRQRDNPGRLLNLRGRAEQIELWPAGSRLETSLVLYELARQLLPGRYLEFLKLQMPYYVKLVLGNNYPRTMVTPRIGGSASLNYGPFRSRAAAEQFEHACLDLFQLRRCQEDLTPTPDHPGCIYGEMNMCLRPCQGAVTPDEYASEANRVQEFLLTEGKLSVASAAAARDRLSAELEFEDAAREHRRMEKIEAAVSLRDELARPAERTDGIAVVPSHREHEAVLFPMRSGCWTGPLRIDVGGGAGESLDSRLKQAVTATAADIAADASDRAEHLALLARWAYSSYCDGTWIPINDPSRVPWRRLVAALSRHVHHSGAAASH
ncbi:MAG TPA: hypothetical protein VES20_08790 [Bryobacteraceae bacterium]|nr:hypothetical protein [Bryobacteraceae bacterium]